MDMDIVVLNKTLPNGTQQHIKEIIHPEEVKFILGMQGWLNIQKANNLPCQQKKM